MQSSDTIPTAKLSDVQEHAAQDGLFRASYNGECFTLSKAQTQAEFVAMRKRIDDAIAAVGKRRNEREAGL